MSISGIYEARLGGCNIIVKEFYVAQLGECNTISGIYVLWLGECNINIRNLCFTVGRVQ